MKCPICGVADLIRETRDIEHRYKGRAKILGKFEGDYCPSCGEGIFCAAAVDRFGQLAQQFEKEVNASLVNPVFIRDVRKKLNLGQREAGEIFGGGVNAFSRYETGKAEPPMALIKLLKLLDRHPELLSEIRSMSSEDNSRALARL